MRRSQTRFLSLLASVTIFSIPMDVNAVSATWTSTSDTNLNATSNWYPTTVPNNVATFDSTITNVVTNPTATSPFIIEEFYFPNEAPFSFVFSDPAYLKFTGVGIQGTNTNTKISVTDSSNLGNPQIYFQ
ncbi:MAG: hypothetical protein WCG42_09085, partial [Parachlamydiaceae bacterium]